MKEAYYFSHDSNARTDEKILALRSIYGAEGYGWYWMLIEKMRDANAFRLQCGGKYDAYAIAVDLQCDAEKLKKFISACIEEFHLFDSDGKFFWSNSLIGRMTIRQQKSEKASLAARKRWEHSERNTDAMQTHSERNAIKGKEKKENNNNNYDLEYDHFILIFNETTGKNYQGDKKSRGKFNARMREKVPMEKIVEALKNAAQNEYMMANNYLTPSYILDAEKIQKWLNATPLPTTPKIPKMAVWK